MKTLILSIILFLTTISIGFSQTKEDLPMYYIQDGDTIGVILTIEQLQKLDNNTDLLPLLENVSMDCDSLDKYYIVVINKMNEKIALLEVKLEDLTKAKSKQENMVNDLKVQVSNSQLRLSMCEDQRINDSVIITGLEKDLKKEKNKGLGAWITSGVVTVVVVVLSIFIGVK